jgi:hypothetical protein
MNKLREKSFPAPRPPLSSSRNVEVFSWQTCHASQPDYSKIHAILRSKSAESTGPKEPDRALIFMLGRRTCFGCSRFHGDRRGGLPQRIAPVPLRRGNNLPPVADSSVQDEPARLVLHLVAETARRNGGIRMACSWQNRCRPSRVLPCVRCLQHFHGTKIAW